MKRLIIHKKVVEWLDWLPRDLAGDAIKALITYNETGEIPNFAELPPLEAMFDIVLKAERLSEIRSNAGKQGAKVTGNKVVNNFAQAKCILPKQNTTFAQAKTDFAQANDMICPSKTENSDNNNIYNINISKDNNLDSKEKIKNKKEKAEALLVERAQAFYNLLIPYVAEYGKELVREFYDYWSEPNIGKTKMRWEQERTWDLKRRIARWARNNKNRNYGNNRQPKQSLDEQAMQVVADYLNGNKPVGKVSDF